MVGINRQPPADDATYLRKIRKPMIERQRRERMNQSITQLRALIDDTVKQNVAPMTRVDKADILELTVCHITNLRQRKQRVTMPTNDRAAYVSGFQDCAREMASFLLSNGLVDESRLADLSRHLHRTFDKRSAQFIPEHGQISTPHRLQDTQNMLEGTPYQLRKISPIQQQVYCSNYSSPAGSEEQDRTFDSGSSFTMSPFTTPYSAPGLSPYTTTGLTHMATVERVQTSTDTTMSTFEDSSSSGSMLGSTDDSMVCSHGGGQTVSIGTGSENKIGHVISDPMWRPW